MKTGAVFLSEKIQTILGFAPEEIQDLETYRNLIHKDDLPGTSSVMDSFTEGKGLFLRLSIVCRQNPGIGNGCLEEGE